MKVTTKLFAGLLAAGVGWAALSMPAWRSESGKGPAVKPTSTAERRSVTFTVTFTPGSNDFGPQVVAYTWNVGPANGSGVLTNSGAVVNTHRGRRGELVHFSAAARKDRKGGIAAQYLDAEAFYGGLPFGPNCSVDARAGEACAIVAHVPAVS